jgi:hypothetical protein
MRLPLVTGEAGGGGRGVKEVEGGGGEKIISCFSSEIKLQLSFEPDLKAAKKLQRL